MGKKLIKVKEEETRSRVIVPSRVYEPQDYEGAEETEIAAQISVPEEGGWGWVVVLSSFMCLFIVDGIFFTFGAIYPDMTIDLGVEDYLVALINSVAVALYFLGGPITSALINRFGFRACTMTGSIICSSSYLASYFSTSYAVLLTFYGIFSGFGACLIGMTCGIVVGFYFEKHRSIAMSISGVGSSLGIMAFFSINTYVVKVAGWRITTLLQSGIFGFIYFLAMTFRPLLSLTVTRTTDDPTRTVTYLPNLSTADHTDLSSDTKKVMPTTTERLFSAVSNANFPTAAEVVDDEIIPTSSEAGPSKATVSKLTLTANNPKSGMSQRQLKQVQSIVSNRSVQKNTNNKNVELTVNIPEAPVKKRGFWARIFQWEEHVAESRPMYRDDAFYEGKLEKLPEYQKSVIARPDATKTGLEYQMAVSRAVTTDDLKDRRGFFTTAVRRILATMMDPKLLKRKSFLCLCGSGFFVFLGFLVPYVYIPNRNKEEGISETHCSMFVSVIGLSNAVGKLLVGALATVYSPLKLYIFVAFVTGAATVAFNFSFAVYYQYIICTLFGIAGASYCSLRSLVIVELYGLQTLTNATGMVVMFQGIGTLISTPMSAILRSQFGFSVSFYVSGMLIIIGGIILMPVRALVKLENKNLGIKTDVSVIKSVSPNQK